VSVRQTAQNVDTLTGLDEQEIANDSLQGVADRDRRPVHFLVI
jgi:hypothetical protein